MKLCKLPDLEDWKNPDFLRVLDELHLGWGRRDVHRKHWEFVHASLGLQQLGCLTETALALGVGAGHEHPIYYLANHVAKVHATDIYGSGDFAANEASWDMLVHPEKHAPFPYREDRLVVQWMDGCDLKYPAESFDIAFSFSSIEHFGGHEQSGRAMQEIARVLRPGGTAVLTTEVVLNGATHPEYFLPHEIDRCLVRPSGLRLVEPIDFSISPELLAKPVDLTTDFSRIFPHIVLKAGPVVFTSVLMFLQKPRV